MTRVRTFYPATYQRFREQLPGVIRAAGLPTEPFTGPVTVGVQVFIPRPKSHYGTGRNAARVKDSAPRLPVNRATGDVDNHAKGVLDGLVAAGVMPDDSVVTILNVSKRYARCDPGIMVQIETLPV